jgi:hypothetical protein
VPNYLLTGDPGGAEHRQFHSFIPLRYRRADVDLYTALTSGLTAQQNANEPGGDRWTRQLDRVISMYLAEVSGHRSQY